eukprot:TRINITY_DN25621_c0_g1_i1.p1 TRINITY_DN25621_c0_g1~~TRINITY_DN25621_c0_g1_i1.p1  ORF type:complete len:471 (+),score=25.45 TRINITY_DN25621_c0_g1_i1:332-1744(+)
MASRTYLVPLSPETPTMKRDRETAAAAGGNTLRQKRPRIAAAAPLDDTRRVSWTAAAPSFAPPQSLGFLPPSYPAALSSFASWMPPPSYYMWPSYTSFAGVGMPLPGGIPLAPAGMPAGCHWPGSVPAIAVSYGLHSNVAPPFLDAEASDMQRVASSQHINTLVAHYGFPPASPVGRASSPRATKRAETPVASIVSEPRGSASNLPSLLESPIQSEAAPQSSASAESTVANGAATGAVLGSPATDVEDGVVNGAKQAEVATDLPVEIGDEWHVSSGTRRAMEAWLEEVEVGGRANMGPFDWLEEPATKDEPSGLPHWVLAELGDAEKQKAAAEDTTKVEEVMYQILFRTDSMESSSVSPNGGDRHFKASSSAGESNAEETLNGDKNCAQKSTAQEQQGESHGAPDTMTDAKSSAPIEADLLQEVQAGAPLSRSFSTSWMNDLVDDTDLATMKRSNITWHDILDIEGMPLV